MTTQAVPDGAKGPFWLLVTADLPASYLYFFANFDGEPAGGYRLLRVDGDSVDLSYQRERIMSGLVRGGGEQFTSRDAAQAALDLLAMIAARRDRPEQTEAPSDPLVPGQDASLTWEQARAHFAATGCTGSVAIDKADAFWQKHCVALLEHMDDDALVAFWEALGSAEGWDECSGPGITRQPNISDRTFFLRPLKARYSALRRRQAFVEEYQKPGRRVLDATHLIGGEVTPISDSELPMLQRVWRERFDPAWRWRWGVYSPTRDYGSGYSLDEAAAWSAAEEAARQ